MFYRAVNEPLVILAINPGVQPKIFQRKGGFVELGHLDKYFNKNERKKVTQRNIWDVFLLDTF